MLIRTLQAITIVCLEKIREEIYKKFGKYYSIEEIDQFIDVLITEGILCLLYTSGVEKYKRI